MARLILVLAALCVAMLAPAALAEPILDAPPSPLPSLPYRLSATQPGALPKGSNKLAYVHSYGPVLFTDASKPPPLLTPDAKVLLAVARTGKVQDRHLMRCYVAGAPAIVISHFKGTNGPEIAVPQDKDLVTSETVQDGDDGKVDGRFSFRFYFLEDRDFIQIKSAQPDGNAWTFKSCRIMIEGIGNDDDYVQPVPVVTNADSLWSFRPFAPRRSRKVESAVRFAEVGSVNYVSVGPSFNELQPGYAWYPKPPNVQLSATVQLRLVRMGSNPTQKHQLRCRGSIASVGLKHFRQKPSAAPNDFSGASLFKSVTLEKIDVPGQPFVSIV